MKPASLADFRCGPLLDALSLSRFELAPHPGPCAPLERLRARPSWQKCEFREGSAR